MEKLKIAIQKSGRLNEGSLALLKECGIKIENGKDQLLTQASNFPMEVLYLRNGDIPQYLKDEVVDIAIIGENTLIEKNAEELKTLSLGFSRCRFSIAVPRNAEFKSIKDLENRRIATSYPHTVQTFLDREGIKAKIHEISGSVEISPNIGLADAICDIVSTGSTLFKNGLTEVYTIFKFEAVLAANPNLSEKKKEILTRLIFRIESVLRARNTKYIMLNAHKKDVENICSILPGLKSPTIIPLEEPDWVSIHSVILEDEFWDLIDQLKQNNAENILILPIEKILV
ncbi:ATP phosphoribosyltransferase [Bacteroides propionicifaciens]|uniref:ATP phosphoribosyltransferase n=1 Tax=Bacteroides propionicifaciens TaxID=392838 RepID=UPI0003657268|nr:ATP phosphoribosyltransferase [Bacteroides propionicifaciens]